MRMIRWASLAVAGLVAVVLLTPAPLRAQEVEIKPTTKVKRDKYVILADEIAEHSDLTDGFDVIKKLRGQWLKVTRGSGGALGSADTDPQGKLGSGCRKSDPNCTPGSSGGSSGPVPHESGSPYAESGASMNSAGRVEPVLYINDIKRQSLDELKTLRAPDIAEARYLTGNQAVGRYGTGHENGAILVKTK